MTNSTGKPGGGSDSQGGEAAQEQGQQSKQHDGGKPEQSGTDWQAEARKWEQRAKDNYSAAQELDKLKDAEKTELQKLTDRAAQAEQQLEVEKTARLRSEVAASKGVPASAVTGSTREEMEAAADDLLAWRGGDSSSRSSGGGFGSGASGTGAGLSGREKAAAAVRRLRN